MLQIVKKIFYSFKERPDIWFFYAFLATSTLSIRKILYYYPINNAFNEYTGIYIYLSDIFLLLTMAMWIFVLYNKSSLLSIYNTLQNCSMWNIIDKNYATDVPRLPRTMFHVEHLFWGGTISLFKKAYQQVAHNFILLFPLFLVIFSFVSILWSQRQEIAIFKSVKLFELAFLFFYTYKLFHVEQFIKNAWHIKNIFKIIMAIGLIQSIIGMIQFFIQHSIGLLWLKESIISAELTGVGKLIIDGNVYVRSYGLFPHPNIFGGFLIFSIIVSIMYLKLFNRPTKKMGVYSIDSGQTLEIGKDFKQKNVPSEYKCSTWNIIWDKYVTFLNRLVTNKIETIVLIIILIQGIALLLTFSKSAVIGLVISIFYLHYDKLIIHQQQPVSVSCNSRGIIFSLFKSICSCKKIFLIIGIIFMLFLIIKPFKNPVIFKSLQERVFYLNVSRGTFLSDPLLGSGSGQFVINMQHIADIQTWQFQPVHNVFLLILNEFGIILFFMFLFFIYKILTGKSCFTNQNKCSTWNIFKKSDRTENKLACEIIDYQSLCVYFKATMIAFTFVMLFDHYFWDIQQGQILLWLLFGVLAGNEKRLVT